VTTGTRCPWLAALLGSILVIPTAVAALLPATFVIQQAELRWKEASSLVVDREVTRQDAGGAFHERVWWRGGRIRVDGPHGAWVYAIGRPSPAVDHRPGIIDAIFLTPQGQLERLVRNMGVDLDSVALDRIPRADGSLPFDVIYRLGNTARRSAPHIEITKDTWTIRALQFSDPIDGHLWRAEYDGHGRSSLLPPWLPTHILVFRDGMLFESVRVLRLVDMPVPMSLFDVPAGSGQAPRNTSTDEQ